jgi:hypothetical protein
MDLAFSLRLLSFSSSPSVIDPSNENILGSWTLHSGLLRYFLHQIYDSVHSVHSDRFSWNANCLDSSITLRTESSSHGSHSICISSPTNTALVHAFQVSSEHLSIILPLQWIPAAISLLSLLLPRLPSTATCHAKYYEQGCFTLSGLFAQDSIFIQILCASILEINNQSEPQSAQDSGFILF